MNPDPGRWVPQAPHTQSHSRFGSRNWVPPQDVGFLPSTERRVPEIGSIPGLSIGNFGTIKVKPPRIH